MRIKNAKLLPGLTLFLASLVLSGPRAEAQTAIIPARITEAVDEKNLVTLKGNVRPLARAEFDQGAVSDGQSLHRMLLLLQRSPDQEAALQKLLDDQQNKSLANYHAWLTPAQFGQQFGPADADIQVVTSWLQSRGFQISNVAIGRTVIEFSGSAAQVASAFHTEMHKYLVNGEAHMANASDPQIPAALAPVVAGVVSLNNFPSKSHLIPLGSFSRSKSTGETRPLTTTGICGPSDCFALGPADFGTIYNSAPLLNGTPKIDGTGQAIAIVGESNINLADVSDFRTAFHLPQNFSASNVILNGTDPGINPSEGESDLDVQWAGAVAQGATIDFVTSAPTETTAGIHLSALYIVENNLAGIMSESFGGCEQHIGTLNQFYNSLWEQAAAQGITVMVSAGDGGSAGCDNFDTAQTATQGLAVSGFASTPFNVAVGGTDFDDVNRWTQFWSLTNDPTTQGSALGYIPEIPWNDSCAQLGISGCGASAPQGSLNIVAGSGGASTLYAKPPWQSGTGVPVDNHRDVPDISLFASNGFDSSFYIMCQRDVTAMLPCTINIFQGAGGTSASSPAFAGIMALVNQSLATANNPAPRQGNANYVLYQLFAKQTNTTPPLNCNPSATPSSACTFYDVTRGNSALANSSTGTNSVPCAGNSTNCSSKVAGTNGILVTSANPSAPAYSTTAGYDLATGLGSVNVANLVKNWTTVSSLPSTTTLSATVNGQSASSITGITHGTPVNLSSTVAAGQGVNGTPSGQVALLATPNPSAGTPGSSLAFDILNLSNGTATGTKVVLPGGTYSLTAHYQGDGTFGASDSPGISVNVSAEPSKTLISLPIFDPNTGSETGNAPTTFVYGSPYIGRIDVGNASASSSFPQQPVCNPPNCPTGTITLADAVNGGTAAPIDGGTFPLNISGFTEDLSIQLSGGTHELTATYNGDASYAASKGTYGVAVTPAPTTTGPSNPPLPAQISTPFGVGATVRTQSSGVTPGCNFTVLDGSTPLTGTVSCSGQPGGPNSGAFLQPSLIIQQATSGTHTYTLKYNGDANYAPSTSAPMTTHVFDGTTTSVSANPTTVQFGSSITLTAIVDTFQAQGPAISNAVSFSVGSTPVSGTITYTPMTDASGNIALQATLTTTPQSTGSYLAAFAGDSNYSSSGAFVFVSVNIPNFSIAAAPSSIPVTAGQQGTATITVTPSSAATSPVTLSCMSTSVPAGATCNFSPSTVTLINSNAATTTFTLTTLAPSSSTSVSAAPLEMPTLFRRQSAPWSLAATTILIIFICLTRSRLSRGRRIALGSASALMASIAIGCGGGSSGGGGGGGTVTPAATSITLTTPSTKAPNTSPPAITAKVTSSNTATGTVTFLDQGTALGTVNLGADGTAPISMAGLPIGTHVITASYSGDAKNLSSKTNGALNQVITGSTTLFVIGTTGGLTNLTSIAVTIQ
jgi:Pro-kumamolisin, activation domain/Bacterial Ig-like domain (group 3)